jgi:3-oxoacyl-[acyl-carrier protein] reductase
VNVALVTGGSGGIGRAVCAELAARGAAVAVHYNRGRAAAEELAAALGNAVAVGADLASRDGPNELVAAASELLGPVTILVNNAGPMTDARVEELGDELLEETLTVHLTAAFRLCRAVVPGMRAAGFGRIVNVSSQAALMGSVAHAHYAAAKAGLHGLTFSLAKELGSDGITVNMARADAAAPLRHAGGGRSRRRVPRLGGGELRDRRRDQRQRRVVHGLRRAIAEAQRPCASPRTGATIARPERRSRPARRAARRRRDRPGRPPLASARRRRSRR